MTARSTCCHLRADRGWLSACIMLQDAGQGGQVKAEQRQLQLTPGRRKQLQDACTKNPGLSMHQVQLLLQAAHQRVSDASLCFGMRGQSKCSWIPAARQPMRSASRTVRKILLTCAYMQVTECLEAADAGREYQAPALGSGATLRRSTAMR